MLISAIVAMSQNRVIGNKNQLPWSLPADLKYFKQKTEGHSIVMGRKTYESIGRPLPKRENIIITRDPHYAVEGCIVKHSIEAALLYLKDRGEIFVIGGAQLYEQMLPQIQRLYLTLIHHNFEGDVFFPELNLKEWKEVSRQDYDPDEKNAYRYSFLVLERGSSK